jgi:hypothetical protein
MNWDAIGSIGEVVGAVGVVLSLAYLGIQIRQNSRATEEEIFQSLLNNYHGAMDYLISDQDLNRIWYLGFRDFDALNGDEKMLWITQVHAAMRRYENIILQSRKYNVNLDVVAGIENQWNWLLGQPGAKKFWIKGHHAYSDEFVRFVAEHHQLDI